MTEYFVGGLVVMMEASVARRRLGIAGSDVLLITVDPASREEVGRRLEELAGTAGLLLQSNEQLHQEVEGMLRGIEASMLALLAVGVAVTGFGVVNCLTLNILEQTRELGILRALGMTRRQLLRTVLGQAWIMGLVSIALGTPIGLLLSYLMNLSTAVLYGQRVEFAIRPVLVGAVVLGALAVIVLAAVVPARRTATIIPLAALRYE
jgi:putative ABC transport system permease protein